MKYDAVQEGIFVSRPNRFIALQLSKTSKAMKSPHLLQKVMYVRSRGVFCLDKRHGPNMEGTDFYGRSISA